MKPITETELVNYTKTEELLHTVTHGAGLILSVLIAATCLAPAVRAGDALRIVCASLYLFGTTVMFLTSALYHGTKPSKAKRILRLLDHCMIFFAVAGTATGCVPPVRELVGLAPAVTLTVCAWFGAVSGLILTFFSFERTKGLQMGLYIGTALCCAVAGGKTFTVLPRGAFMCFLGGSAALLTGAVLYGVGKKKRWFHAVFHVFIDIGLTVFFIGIRKYCF
ncbi:MAG: hemolysin III family protein [Clostridia bacterium]|nr:hemolysin III family protein [Clostridia bacterium]